MSSERQTKYGRSSYRLVHEQRMLANLKAKLRQYEQRTSNEVRTQFVPFGARTANAGKEQRKNEFASTCPPLNHYSLIRNPQFHPRNP